MAGITCIAVHSYLLLAYRYAIAQSSQNPFILRQRKLFISEGLKYFLPFSSCEHGLRTVS